MVSFPAVASVFGLAFFWFVGAIPAGIALALPPVVAGLTAWAAYSAGALLIVLAGAPLRTWLLRRFNVSLAHDSTKLFWRVWDRYALTGLALLAPVTLGSQLGALLGLALGVPPRALLIALTLGALVWAALITLVTVLGVEVIL
jgi:hypothetical protein